MKQASTLAAGCLTVLLGLLVSPAAATTCADQSAAEQFRAADVVFVGTVEESLGVHRHGVAWQLRVDELRKGNLPSAVTVTGPASGDAVSAFAPSTRHLVFGQLRDGVVVTNMCMGTAALAAGAAVDWSAYPSDGGTSPWLLIAAAAAFAVLVVVTVRRRRRHRTTPPS